MVALKHIIEGFFKTKRVPVSRLSPFLKSFSALSAALRETALILTPSARSR